MNKPTRLLLLLFVWVATTSALAQAAAIQPRPSAPAAVTTDPEVDRRSAQRFAPANAAHILSAAKAAVTPGYGRLGHMARRRNSAAAAEGQGTHDFPVVERGEGEMPASHQRRSSKKLSAAEKRRRAAAAAAAARRKREAAAKKAAAEAAAKKKAAAEAAAKKAAAEAAAKKSAAAAAAAAKAKATSTTAIVNRKSAQCTRKSTTSSASATLKVTTSSATKSSSSTAKAATSTTKSSSSSSSSAKVANSTSASSTAKATTSTPATSSSTRASTTASSSSTTATTTSSYISYPSSSVLSDLNTIMSWAGDSSALNSSQKAETVAALLSATSRYFPELPQQDAVRYLLADIKAESDFNATAYNGGRLDSGASLGLMQVSPASGAQELPLWMGHALVSYSDYSWSASNGTQGPLIDYATGQQMILSALTAQDLFRPWINIHLGAWVQSNLARTSSCDPYSWTDISEKAAAARSAEQSYASAKSSALYAKMQSAQSAETSCLVCAGLPRSVLTGLGSWVAGPAVDGDDSYTGSGDDVSAPYFANIVSGLQVLYDDDSIGTDWLDGLVLTAGLVDYRD